MSVIFTTEPQQQFTAEEVLWAKKELIDAIVKSALVNQTDSYIAKLIDTERPEDITRASVNLGLRGVKETAWDFLNDVIGDLERAIMQRLEATDYGAAVTGIKYDLAGDVVDIEVDVTVS